jgi:tetratricopeptide (TPR) repeat protein
MDQRSLSNSQAEDHFKRGDAHRQRQEFKDALLSYEQALAINPDHAQACANRGSILKILGRVAEAELDYRRAVAIDPGLVEGHYNLGNLLRETARMAEAEACFRRVIALRPGIDRAHRNLGRVLAELGRFDEAVSQLRQALELGPDFVGALVDLGHVLRMAGNAKEAEDASRKAVALAPDNATAHLNLGFALQDQGRIDEAVECFRQSSRRNPRYAKAAFAEGLAHLLRGDFAAGLNKYEARWSINEAAPRTFAQPQWHGEDPLGRRILLHAEQGAGDSIQFLRYVPLVAERAGTVILEVPSNLVSLAATLRRGGLLIAQGQSLPEFDCHCPLLSLPRAFGTTRDSIPASIPYLGAPPDRIPSWRQRLPASGALRIGFAWAGNAVHRADRFRSMPLAALAPLFGVAGTQWYSLQVGPRSADLSNGPKAIIDLSSALTDFGETAAAIANLDLVVSVDTAVAHLAGALGKPVWLMIPFAPDWRWFLHRDDSPWYPSMRLFRQTQPGDWPGVVMAIRKALGPPFTGIAALDRSAHRPN